ncbi:helix-turn-helix domain-containing protein [Carnobacterium sp. TMP28]|uniref:helix-turn-helix domain-containing protein n=1 Tax=Carnobacterium sp. TMP28 TaxID=3397060 RepID=UPI0039E13742
MLWLEVEKIMKEKGSNQTTLAKKIGTSQSVLAELKRENIKKPSFDLVCKIAEALEVSLDEFK